MIAVVKIGGHQEIVQAGDIIQVDKIDAKEGAKVSLETLLISEPDGKGFKVGAPILKDVAVEAKIVDHGKGEKIRIYKMKPRKRYRRTQGHRQDYTTIEIVNVGGKAAKAPAKKAAAKKEEPKAEKKKPAAKKPATKKPATKKPAAKKPAAKKA